MDTSIIMLNSIERQIMVICNRIKNSNKWNIEYHGTCKNILGFRLFYGIKYILYFYHTDSISNIKLKIIKNMYFNELGRITCKLKKI